MVNPDEDILQQFVQEEPSESPLTLLAANTTTASDAPSGSLNAYRASGASVQPAKDPTEVFKQLHPEAATRIQRFFELADERGLGLKPGSMNRDYGTQAKMYANRASNPYPVAPPGSSAHMGFATDFSGYKPEKLDAIRELAKEVGLVYGGNWSGKTFDPVHIQLGPGSDVTRYIQGHIDPKAGTVNWEGVRSTQLPEDFIARAIAAAQGQNVPVKEVKVEGASNATGTVTAAAEPSVEEADAKVEVTKKRSKDIDLAKLIKMLDDSTSNSGDMLRKTMQANAQQQQEQRSRTLSQIAQFDQEQVNKMAEALKSGKPQGYKEGGPKLPDRPEYEITDNSDAVDMTPAGPWERTFQKVTGGRNLQNDLSNIQSRLPTMEDYGKALLHQRDVAQETSELGRHNLREGYTNRDLPQMLLGTGQGVMGLVSPAMTPVNAGLDVLVNTAGKFDPRAKAEAERISLMGTEGTGAAHGSLKTLGDAIVKASERVKLPEASLIALPAAVAAAERPAEAVTRSLSPVGLYSHAAEMAEALPQAKGTPEQMRAMLFDKYGVKKAELEGFEEKFFGRPSVTKEELATHFRERMPQVEEKVLKPISDTKQSDMAIDYWLEQNHYKRLDDAAEELGVNERTLRNSILEDENNFKNITTTKYSDRTLPGGENYREVLLKLPSDAKAPTFEQWYEKTHIKPLESYADDPRMMEIFRNKYDAEVKNMPKEVSFKSTHWDDPNVLAHLRMSDRTGPNGEKLLHVEEMQSDWGQKGRKEGFVNPEEHVKWEKNARDIYQEVSNAQEAHRELTNRIAPTINEEFKAGRETPREYEKRVSNLINARQDLLRSNPEWQASLKRVRDANDARNNISPRPSREGVPSAPYVTSTQGWTDLALKRVLKEAAEGGYEGVVFTPGAEQAKRYDLSQQIDELAHWRSGDEIGLSASGPEGTVLDQHYVSKEKLPSVVGKELAEKILNGEGSSKSVTGYPEEEGVNFISGEGLSVGGEGMKGYYDKIVPTQLKEMVKRYDKDAKLGTMRTNSLPDMLHMPVTDKMREHILKGQKAYMRGGRVGYADGGLVADNADGTGRQQYDAYGNVSDSQGGPVHAVQYDPDRINMMAQQLHEGTYG